MATVPINVVNGVVQSPPSATVNRIDQNLIWVINNQPGSGIVFANPPVVFDPNPPAGYDPWPGGPVQPVSGSPNRWTADVNYRVPPGSPAQRYKYDIVWTTGRLDPDVNNEPYPPDDRDEDKDKDKP